MEEPHNRGSPHLRFTEEELKNDPLTKAVSKAEKAEESYEKARKRLKKRKRPKVAWREVGKSAADTPASPSNDMPSSPMQDSLNADDVKDDLSTFGVSYTHLKPDSIKNPANQNRPGKHQTIPDDYETKNALDSGMAGTKKKAVRLAFQETQVKKPSRLIHPIQKTIRTAGDQLHRQAAQANKDDNVALTAALKADSVTKSALQAGEHAYHAVKLRPYRRLQKAEKALDQANIRILEAKFDREHPQFTSNPISRWQQKRAIRKEYAAAKRGSKSMQKTASNARQAVEKTGETTARTISVISKRPGLLVILALGAMLIFIVSGLQSCAPLMQSVLDPLLIGSYPAKEEDVKAAEQAYLDMENALKDELEHYDSYHPGYDEYIVETDDIGHDPYVLMAIISARPGRYPSPGSKPVV